MTKNDKIQNGRRLFKKLDRSTQKRQLKLIKYNIIFNISWKSLSYIDTYYCISGKYEMYNKALKSDLDQWWSQPL